MDKKSTNANADKLTDYIGHERMRYEDDNKFAFGFGQVSRYYRFLVLIYERYAELSSQFMENSLRTTELCKAQGSGPVGEELSRLLLEGQDLQVQLHLELESFFMFGTVFLDRAACFIEWYFGKPNTGRISSHRRLRNKLPVYVLEKGLTLPEGFESCVTLLEDGLAEFRDKEIVHDRSPRSFHITRFNSDGETSLSKGRLYPREGERHVDGKTPQELIELVERYVDQLIFFIEINRSKCRLPLNDGP